MARSEADVATPHASKYIQQLCKHWSHKFTVDYDTGHGRIDLGEGRVCSMRAFPERLAVSADAGDADALPRLEQVIADHIKRFAFREELTFDWQSRAE